MRPLHHVVLATVVLCIASAGYTFHMPEFGRFFSGTNDFLPRYTQARSVGNGHMYEIETGYREQERATGLHIVGAYHDRMPWQALLMWPLGRLPYHTAYWLWISFSLVCFVILARYWLLPRDCILWGAVFFPAAASLIVGQEGLALTLCAAGVIILAERRSDLAAGALLALCTAKPHLFLLVPIVLIAHRRWRIIGGATVGTLLLLAAGTAAAGAGWVSSWLNIVRVLGLDNGLDVASRPTIFQVGVNAWTVGVAVLLALAFGVAIWRSRSFEHGMGLAIIGSILIAPHTSVYDLPLLLVGLLGLPLQGWRRWLRIVLLTPVPYWALLNGSPWNALAPLLLAAVSTASAWTLFSGAGEVAVSRPATNAG